MSFWDVYPGSGTGISSGLKAEKERGTKTGGPKRGPESGSFGGLVGKVGGTEEREGTKVPNPCVTGLKIVSLKTSGGISQKLKSRKVKRQKYTGIYIFKRQLFAREINNLRVLGN